VDKLSQSAPTFRPGLKKALTKIWIGGVLLCSLVWPAAAQTAEIATQIYRKASPAVFVILLRDTKGSPISFGFGFVIAKNALVTNFHVVEGGSVFLCQGALNIPARVEKQIRRTIWPFFTSTSTSTRIS
jgi:hypothetical protein